MGLFSLFSATVLSLFICLIFGQQSSPNNSPPKPNGFRYYSTILPPYVENSASTAKGDKKSMEIAQNTDDRNSELDSALKNRVSILQNLSMMLNRFIGNLSNFVLSFVSQKSMFGGNTRRSIFDTSNIIALQSLHKDFELVCSAGKVLIMTVIKDVQRVFCYIASSPNFGIIELFKAAVAGFVDAVLYIPLAVQNSFSFGNSKTETTQAPNLPPQSP